MREYAKAEPRLSYVSVPDLGVVPVSEVDRLREELEQAKRARVDEVVKLREEISKEMEERLRQFFQGFKSDEDSMSPPLDGSRILGSGSDNKKKP